MAKKVSKKEEKQIANIFKKEKNLGGRPTIFSEELAREICHSISTSSLGLRDLISKNNHWPTRSTVYDWINKNDWFSDLYAKAKVNQVEWLVEHAMDIALDGSKDTYEDANGIARCDTEWVNRCRLGVDTIKWYASKLSPRLYGDKKELEEEKEKNEELRQQIASLRLKLDAENKRDY